MISPKKLPRIFFFLSVSRTQYALLLGVFFKIVVQILTGDATMVCGCFSWDNGEYERLSPWDMEPINENCKCSVH